MALTTRQCLPGLHNPIRWWTMTILLILLALLGADNFRLRESASSAMLRLAPFVWTCLEDVRNVPLETRLRCQKVFAQHWPTLPLTARQAHVAGMRPCGWSMLPWLCLARSSHLLSGNGASYGGWAGYRVATALWLLESAETMMPAAILAELERMATAEDDWVAENWNLYITSGGQRRHAR